MAVRPRRWSCQVLLICPHNDSLLHLGLPQQECTKGVVRHKWLHCVYSTPAFCFFFFISCLHVPCTQFLQCSSFMAAVIQTVLLPIALTHTYCSYSLPLTPTEDWIPPFSPTVVGIILLSCLIVMLISQGLTLTRRARFPIASVLLSFMETQPHVIFPFPFNVGQNAEETFWSYNGRDQIPYFGIGHWYDSA